MRIKFIDIEFAKKAGQDDIMEIALVPSKLEKLFGKKERTIKVFGDCTVWHYADGSGRCDSSMEGVLSNFWSFAKFQRQGKK